MFILRNAVPSAFTVTVCMEAVLGGAFGTALRLGLVSVGVLTAVTYIGRDGCEGKIYRNAADGHLVPPHSGK